MVKNKWNNKVYEVISQNGNEVELRRCMRFFLVVECGLIWANSR